MRRWRSIAFLATIARAAPFDGDCPAPQDRVADLLRDLEPAFRDTGLAGHHVVADDGAITAATVVKLDVPPEVALTWMNGDWGRWWNHGRAWNFRYGPDGRHSFDFSPLEVGGFGPTHVTVQMGPPVRHRLPDGRSLYRIPVRLGGDFAGNAYFDVEQTADGGSVVRSVWESVRAQGMKAHVADLVAGMHVRVETGNVPFHANTGLAGLRARTSRRTVLRSATGNTQGGR